MENLYGQFDSHGSLPKSIEHSVTAIGHRVPRSRVNSLLNQFLLLVINSSSINKINNRYQSRVSHKFSILLRPISPSHHCSNIEKFRSINTQSNYVHVSINLGIMEFNVSGTFRGRDKLKLKITQARSSRIARREFLAQPLRHPYLQTFKFNTRQPQTKLPRNIDQLLGANASTNLLRCRAIN